VVGSEFEFEFVYVFEFGFGLMMVQSCFVEWVLVVTG